MKEELKMSSRTSFRTPLLERAWATMPEGIRKTLSSEPIIPAIAAEEALQEVMIERWNISAAVLDSEEGTAGTPTEWDGKGKNKEKYMSSDVFSHYLVSFRRLKPGESHVQRC